MQPTQSSSGATPVHPYWLQVLSIETFRVGFAKRRLRPRLHREMMTRLTPDEVASIPVKFKP